MGRYAIVMVGGPAGILSAAYKCLFFYPPFPPHVKYTSAINGIFCLLLFSAKNKLGFYDILDITFRRVKPYPA